MAQDIDRWLGRHLMVLRRKRGMTHSEIADLVDQSPADIEAFEKGTMRMTAACLMQLMRKLDISLPLFFLDADFAGDDRLKLAAPPTGATTPSIAEGLQLMKLFHSIQDPAKRASVLNFVSAVASTIH